MISIFTGSWRGRLENLKVRKLVNLIYNFNYADLLRFNSEPLKFLRQPHVQMSWLKILRCRKFVKKKFLANRAVLFLVYTLTLRACIFCKAKIEKSVIFHSFWC